MYNIMKINKKYISIACLSVLLIMILFVSSGVMAHDDSGISTEEDSRLVVIEINENGDANWVIEQREILHNDEDRKEFEGKISEIENNNMYKNKQLEKYNSTINVAELETNRSMSLDNLRVSAEILKYGYVGRTKITFTWNNFANINKNRNIIIGDIFHDGYNLEENEELEFYWDDEVLKMNNSEYALEPKVTGRNYIIWDGPGTFGDNEMNITLNSRDDNITEDGTVGFGAFVTFIAFISIILMVLRKEN